MKRNFKELLMIVVITVATATFAVAQVTTSSVSGNIVEPNGAAVGVTVTAIHQPT